MNYASISIKLITILIAAFAFNINAGILKAPIRKGFYVSPEEIGREAAREFLADLSLCTRAEYVPSLTFGIFMPQTNSWLHDLTKACEEGYLTSKKAFAVYKDYYQAFCITLREFDVQQLVLEKDVALSKARKNAFNCALKCSSLAKHASDYQTARQKILLFLDQHHRRNIVRNSDMVRILLANCQQIPRHIPTFITFLRLNSPDALTPEIANADTLRDDEGRTLLMQLINNGGDYDSIEYLLSKGANLHVRMPETNETALILALKQSRPINFGYRVTTLRSNYRNSYLQIIDLLLRNGANPEDRDPSNQSTLEILVKQLRMY